MVVVGNYVFFYLFSLVVVILQVSLELAQAQTLLRLTQHKSLLKVVVSDIQVDVVDRKWDMQGSVSVKSVAVLDHTTLGQCKDIRRHCARIITPVVIVTIATVQKHD